VRVTVGTLLLEVLLSHCDIIQFPSIAIPPKVPYLINYTMCTQVSTGVDQRERERQTARERERQRGRDRKRETQTERDTDRKRHREKDGERQRQRDTDRETERQTQSSLWGTHCSRCE